MFDLARYLQSNAVPAAREILDEHAGALGSAAVALGVGAMAANALVAWRIRQNRKAGIPRVGTFVDLATLKLMPPALGRLLILGQNADRGAVGGGRRRVLDQRLDPGGSRRPFHLLSDCRFPDQQHESRYRPDPYAHYSAPRVPVRV